MDVRNKKILVVGIGKSGMAAAVFLASRGAAVTVTDMADASAVAAAAGDLRARGIAV